LLEHIQLTINKLKPDLLLSRQRIAIVSHIPHDISHQALTSFFKYLNCPRLLIVSSVIENAMSPDKASVKLGEEYDGVIFDARDKFEPNALGIVSGVLCGGGMLIIFLPDAKQWLKWNSNYITHLKALLAEREGVYYIDENSKVTEKFRCIAAREVKLESIQAPYKSIEQQETVDKLARLISSKSDACAVLTSGRGRGKTSSLGLLVADLVADATYKIIITSPRKSITEPFFKHLINQCPEAKENRYGYEVNCSSVEFVAPDALLNNKSAADLLLIDEAAAIPLPMLKEILNNYRKVIFSTTTHGYEGTGRGFVLKFYKLLDDCRPNWLKIELHQPIRWRKDDYLERWIEDVLFLNTKYTNVLNSPKSPRDCQIELVDRHLLVNDKNKISAIFSLLVSAHYRTSPADFQYLLDNENVRIYLLRHTESILGVLVISEEGGFDKDLSSQIYRGERRPKGHLLAQTLCFHAGYESAAQLKYARVMRIAIHPDVQHQGLGSYFLQQVIEQERNYDVDVFGSSFSATLELLKFWKNAGLSVLRIGFSRDHVTASHAAVVGLSLSEQGAVLVNTLASKFERNLDAWQRGPLNLLADDIKRYLHSNIEYYDQSFSILDSLDVNSFANNNRNYEACMPAINRLIKEYDIFPDDMSRQEKDIITISCQYAGNWKKVAEKMDVSGKSAAVTLFRSALSLLLKDYKNKNDG